MNYRNATGSALVHVAAGWHAGHAALRRLGCVRVAAIFGDEKPSALVECHRARRLDQRLGGDEFDAQGWLDFEGLQLFIWRERRCEQ